MYRLLASAVFIMACGRSGSDAKTADEVPDNVAGPIEMLESHRDGTALWHSDDLWVSVVQDWERASPIRLSREKGPVERTISGWVAGVAHGRVYVLVPRDGEVSVESIGVTGEPTVLGTVPSVDRPYSYSLTLTAKREVVVAGGVHTNTNDVTVIGSGAIRRFSSIILPGDAIRGIAAHPSLPRIALTLHQVSGTPTIDRSARVVVVDTDSGSVVSTVELGGHFSAIEGEVAFDSSGALWVHHDERFERFDGDARTSSLVGARVDARNLVFAPDGSAIAFTRKHGGGHMSVGPGSCSVYYVRMAETKTFFDPAKEFRGECYFGMGLAIVDGTLWVAGSEH